MLKKVKHIMILIDNSSPVIIRLIDYLQQLKKWAYPIVHFLFE